MDIELILLQDQFFKKSLHGGSFVTVAVGHWITKMITHIMRTKTTRMFLR